MLGRLGTGFAGVRGVVHTDAHDGRRPGQRRTDAHFSRSVEFCEFVGFERSPDSCDAAGGEEVRVDVGYQWAEVEADSVIADHRNLVSYRSQAQQFHTVPLY